MKAVRSEPLTSPTISPGMKALTKAGLLDGFVIPGCYHAFGIEDHLGAGGGSAGAVGSAALRGAR